MGRINDIIQVLKTITVEEQEEVLLSALKRSERVLIELNQSQLLAGEYSTGEDIRPEYSPITVKIKEAKGQPSDRVTLKDKGDFYQSFFVTTDRFPVMFLATDEKTRSLIQKYGEIIFGLSNQSQEVVRQVIIKGALQEYYRNKLSNL